MESTYAFAQYFNPRAYVRHDRLSSRSSPNSSNFNPRAYVRHDPGATPPTPPDTRTGISIHVPT